MTDYTFEFHKGVVPVVLMNNYHKVLTITNTKQSYSYYPERHTDISSLVTFHRHQLLCILHNYFRALSG